MYHTTSAIIVLCLIYLYFILLNVSQKKKKKKKEKKEMVHKHLCNIVTTGLISLFSLLKMHHGVVNQKNEYIYILIAFTY